MFVPNQFRPLVRGMIEIQGLPEKWLPVALPLLESNEPSGVPGVIECRFACRSIQ